MHRLARARGPRARPARGGVSAPCGARRLTPARRWLQDRGAFQEGAAAVLDGFLEEAGAGSAGVEIEKRAVQGSAADALIQAAGPDDLIVGSRGHGGFASLLLGSVSQQTAMHARCPVVIVRG
ncbi:MAG TPA: universal stress protein [Gaiellaceae bacterium]|nr:universal stress protein [Gaiellaceae bacterium]